MNKAIKNTLILYKVRAMKKYKDKDLEPETIPLTEILEIFEENKLRNELGGGLESIPNHGFLTDYSIKFIDKIIENSKEYFKYTVSLNVTSTPKTVTSKGKEIKNPKVILHGEWLYAPATTYSLYHHRPAFPTFAVIIKYLNSILKSVDKNEDYTRIIEYYPAPSTAFQDLCTSNKGLFKAIQLEEKVTYKISDLKDRYQKQTIEQRNANFFIPKFNHRDIEEMDDEGQLTVSMQHNKKRLYTPRELLAFLESRNFFDENNEWGAVKFKYFEDSNVTFKAGKPYTKQVLAGLIYKSQINLPENEANNAEIIFEKLKKEIDNYG